MRNWYKADTAQEIPSPALLVYPNRIEENIRRMIAIAKSPDLLRPHVKTHKMAEIIRLQVTMGITAFKCSTISEAEMTASAGGKDVLLAMQPAGVQIQLFINLIRRYPDVKFSVIVDNPKIVEELAYLINKNNMETGVWLDINNGMNRTGIRPGKEALELYRIVEEIQGLNINGLHVYDGHIHDRELIDRHVACERDFEQVRVLISEIVKSGLKKPVIVAGGTPTFPIHAVRPDTQTSPGTCLLWDSGYDEKFPDLSFLQAAVLMTRVVSKPAGNLLCLDLGHKSIAAEMPHPRIRFFELDVKKFVNHSEEHLVIETDEASKYSCGDIIYGVPWHICPTVPRYPFVYTVRDNMIEGKWKVDARDRV